MDYVAWLRNSGARIAAFESDPSRYMVAVVGSGAAGLSAAYELLRCGVDVTVFEATDRIGGRLFSMKPGDGSLFEMGAMRFSPSERLLHYYANVFNASGASTIIFEEALFPDPGENLTYITFQGSTYLYRPDEQNELPPSYSIVEKGWKAWYENGFTSKDEKISLIAPKQLTQWLAEDPRGNAGRIREAWSAYLQAFGNSSLYEAMQRIFTDENAPGCTQWKRIDFEFFGALGTGFGGFDALFPICFLDIMRFVINAVDAEHHAITTGVSSVVDGFLEQQIELPGKPADRVRNHVRTRMPVTAITRAGTGLRLSFQDKPSEEFDRVIVATSHRAMELTLGLANNGSGRLLETDVTDALRRVHLEYSSKVFVETQRFWASAEPQWPRNVVGDTLLRNLYTLDYGTGRPGVLLFSYTWADDSQKQVTFTDPQDRLNLLLKDLDTISPALAATVASSIDRSTARFIDWQNTPYYFGAFKLNLPGQDAYVHSLFYDFLKVGSSLDGKVYLAGDSVSWMGGWVESAFQTGLNAAAAVAKSLGGSLTAASDSPFQQLRPDDYHYGRAVVRGTDSTPERLAIG
ncbi:MAG TPA: NAD(P)/FAD-dependent oxidoreductase [Archangium sp.]|uniref:flavin monoamine oxidase family protein n=1 Tax=Archangium sp. TaxID=1872627 RepID=UPI002E324E23|nr:NAD(P)/FAD-dependent oxidoreductase [Archangium sp.]HEX5753045.1 NAD(P)/FAD-dependent oxidoreductase [Archangium sp.]